MPLIRAIYECYLHMRFLLKHPDKLRDIVDAKVGLKLGSHAFAKNAKGFPDRRTIIDLKSGETFEGHISVHRMAESSSIEIDRELFPYLYEYLSEFVHPSIQYYPDYHAHTDSMNPMHDDRLFEACCYTISIATMVLDFIRETDLATENMSADIRRVLRRISTRGISLLTETIKDSSPVEFYLMQRLKVLKDAQGHA